MGAGADTCSDSCLPCPNHRNAPPKCVLCLVMQAAGSSMLAAAVAAGMLLAPMPASADMTFGRKALVAERQVGAEARGSIPFLQITIRNNPSMFQIQKSFMPPWKESPALGRPQLRSMRPHTHQTALRLLRIAIASGVRQN